MSPNDLKRFCEDLVNAMLLVVDGVRGVEALLMNEVVSDVLVEEELALETGLVALLFAVALDESSGDEQLKLGEEVLEVQLNQVKLLGFRHDLIKAVDLDLSSVLEHVRQDSTPLLFVCFCRDFRVDRDAYVVDLEGADILDELDPLVYRSKELLIVSLIEIAQGIDVLLGQLNLCIGSKLLTDFNGLMLVNGGELHLS